MRRAKAAVPTLSPSFWRGELFSLTSLTSFEKEVSKKTFGKRWIGSIVINHTGCKPEGYTSRTSAYFFLSLIMFGIYGLVASICNLIFDPAKARNIGYKKDAA